jgi:UDP-N-acetylglucosamine diphosphorylase/glucosamine-1-phosphate N-acetyltransferase
MTYLLFDDHWRNHLLPLAFTRPLSEFRVGISTIREKWEDHLNQPCSWLTQTYLQEKYPALQDEYHCYINGRMIPDEDLLQAIDALPDESVILRENILIACKTSTFFTSIEELFQFKGKTYNFLGPIPQIRNLWDIFQLNGQEIIRDFERITKGRKSRKISKSNTIIGTGELFVEEGAIVEGAILNTEKGPIYIGKEAEVMEGSLIRGPFALLDHAATKLGTKIYGPTTVGPHSKVGGELNNVVIFGYSNKAHDGFLGNAVIGEWCNLGADTNNSNLKNNYAEISLWNYSDDTFSGTGLQFCGLIMGDHAKCGINTMFNTGTVVGVSANVFGAGFPPTFIPDFSWGGAEGFKTYLLRAALNVARLVMMRRNIDLDPVGRKILEEVFNQTEKYRSLKAH